MAPIRRRFKVVWDKDAVSDLEDICQFIEKDSPAAAKKVKQTLIKLAGTLKYFPERHSFEPSLRDEGNYHFISRWHFKIIYKVAEKEVIIIAIFHTSRDVKNLKDLL